MNEGNGRSNSLKGNLFSPFNINSFSSVAAIYNTETGLSCVSVHRGTLKKLQSSISLIPFYGLLASGILTYMPGMSTNEGGKMIP